MSHATTINTSILCKLEILRPGLTGHSGFELENFGLQSRIAGREDFYGEEAGVSAVADGDGGDGDAGGHLYNGEQGVETLQCLGFNRHADDGQGREARDHSGKMRCAARAGDDDAQSALVRRAGVTRHVHRCAVRGDNAGFVRNAEFFADLGGGLERGPIGIAAHDDANKWFRGICFQAASPKRMRPAAR